MINSFLTRSIQGLILGAVPGALTGAALGSLEDKKTALKYAKIGAVSGLLFTPAYTQAAKYYTQNLKSLAGIMTTHTAICNAVSVSCINDLITSFKKR